MAYNGYLIKLGIGVSAVSLPFTYMRAESYMIVPTQKLDLDSYRDADGVLHRSVLSHTASKIEFETPPLDNNKVSALMTLLANNMTDLAERKITLTYYNTLSNGYATGSFYMPNIEFEIYNANTARILYKPCRIAFIEY